MGIISITPGTYTPGAQSSLDAMAAVINAAWDQGNLKTDAFEDKIAAITDEATGWLSTTAAPHVTAGTVTAPTVVEPAVDIPATQSATDIMALFDAKYAELVALLAGKFTEFRSTYFPDESVTYGKAEAWLQAALDNPTAGIPAAVQAQLLTDDRDRLLAEAGRASDQVLAVFAGRRFPLPPGASASAVLQIQQKAQDQIADSSRKIVTTSIEQYKWAVEKVISLRQLAMGSAVEYVKAIASAPEMATKLVGIGYDAQSKLISAAAQFYGARTDVAKLTAQSDQFNVATTLSAAEKNQAADLTIIEDRLKALLTECQALAQMATSLFNNVHASAGTSYAVNGT